MVFTDSTQKYFSLIPFKIRAAMAKDNLSVPFAYENESFFITYEALYQLWVKRQIAKGGRRIYAYCQRHLKEMGRSFYKVWGDGAFAEVVVCNRVDQQLEKLVILIKSCRPHESASYALRMAEALNI